MPAKEVVFSALKNGGYEYVPSYCSSLGFKTNAPHEFLLSMREEWGLLNKDKAFKGKIDFSVNKDVRIQLKNRKPRFLPNPTKFWGPRQAATMRSLKVMKEDKKKGRKIKKKKVKANNKPTRKSKNNPLSK